MMLQQRAPDFTLPGTDGLSHSLPAGQWLVLYFYPKDSTPGCTLESQTFAAFYPQFQALQTEIFGVSRDTLTSHAKFKAKYQLPFELLSDPTEEVCRLYEVMKIKQLYGKKTEGIERSTFLIDPQGRIQHLWRKVKVPGHVEQVLATLKVCQSST